MGAAISNDRNVRNVRNVNVPDRNVNVPDRNVRNVRNVSVGGSSILVAAIDFGTAYSGYGFSFRNSFLSEPTKISCNTWTAASGGLLSLKTPTCALFDPDKNFHSFGFEAEDKYAELSLEKEHIQWYYFRRFKMDLYEKLKLKRSFTLEDIVGKTLPAMQVFSASIGYLKDHLLKTCRDRNPDMEERDIKWVLTVPAIWDDSAKQFMRECAIQAGIDNDRLVIALEPEAASLFCRFLPNEKISGLSSKLSMFTTGSKYMVLDAGGGTIDITVHEVKRHQKLAEIYKASGGRWGGTYVDNAFVDFLTEIVGNDVMKNFIKRETYDYIDILREFEVKKRSFKSTQTENVTFKVPVSLRDMYKQDIQSAIKRTKYNGQVTWIADKLRCHPEIVNDIFEKPCMSIVEHLALLFDKPELEGVDVILMAGGFSESLMLQKYIKDHFWNKRVVIPEEAGLVVVKGAVIFGHDTGAIVERKCKYTYGVGTSLPFVSGKHPRERWFVDDDGCELCSGMFDVHVHIGESLKFGQPQVIKIYYVTSKYQSEMSFLVYASKRHSPEYVDDPGCCHIGSLEVDVPGTGMGREAEVHMVFGDTELQVNATVVQTGESTSATFNFLEDN